MKKKRQPGSVQHPTPFLADLHVHSPYSRAVSREMTLENLHRWAQLKGIAVVGTGDFTHPRWSAELREKLEPAEPGLFRLRPDLADSVDAGIPERCRGEVRFLLTGEISGIYRRYGRTRKVHNLLLLPGFSEADHLAARLGEIGNLESDGRPILGLDSEKLLRIVLETAPGALLIPAHAWTPHFSVFGSHSGFDSLEECFGDLAPHVRAIETGLSSDPAMNWRLAQLDGVTLISNSDAHSPAKLGREANLLRTERSYDGIASALTGADPDGFLGTLEFFPEEGKYHYDGHRNCGSRMTPAESIRRGGICPICGKGITIGVLHRVEDLADRPEGFLPVGAKPFQRLIPLTELVAETLGKGVKTKGVMKVYFSLQERLGNELSILREVPVGEIEKAADPRLAEAVRRMRAGEITLLPGYDGEYGTFRVLPPDLS
ncbi:MAG: DNA helicase UvrD [Nitrospirae bacterium]|nr:DNA helicase UvrD [Nitrospirota bacterium]